MSRTDNMTNPAWPAIDPVLQHLLEEAAAQAGPADPNPDVATMRANHSNQVLKFTPVATRSPANIEEREFTGRHGDNLRLRVYRPIDDDGSPKPTVMWIHGGGWVTGDLGTADPAAREIAAQGAVVVVPDYRRAPEHQFPTAVEDCADALDWVHSHIDELGKMPTGVGVGGDSAGGNLSAILAQQADQRGGRLGGQLLVYPMMDGRTDVGPYPSRADTARQPIFALADVARVAGLYVTEPDQVRDLRVSPILAQDLTGLAPAVIVSCGHDTLWDEDIRYADDLAHAGVQVTHFADPTLSHGVLDMIGSLPRARHLMGRAIREFLDILTNH